MNSMAKWIGQKYFAILGHAADRPAMSSIAFAPNLVIPLIERKGHALTRSVQWKASKKDLHILVDINDFKLLQMESILL